VDNPQFDIWSKTAAQFQETVSQSWTKALANFQNLDLGAAMSAMAHPSAPPAIQFSADKLQAVQQQYLQDAQALMTQMMGEGGLQTQDKRFANPA
jgi:polyhydroxyalkanoate synthase